MSTDHRAHRTIETQHAMLDRILAFSISSRWLVMMASLGVIALGAWNFTRLPIDAVPDITNVQVQVNAQAPGFSPLEVEQRLTFPLENAMGGLPKLDYTRSLSRYGLSQVTVVFKDGTDIYFARQLVNERIQQVKDQLPEGVHTAMGPISTGLGEIYMYTVEAKPERSTQRASPTARWTCGRSRTGSSSRSCAPCRASSRSTPSAASRSSSTCCPIRPG